MVRASIGKEGHATTNAVRSCLRANPHPYPPPQGMRHRHSESGGVLLQGLGREAPAHPEGRRRARCAPYGTKAVPPSTPYAHASGQIYTRARATRHAPPASLKRRHSFTGSGARRPRLTRKGEGADDARPTGRRPCQWQCRALMPRGKPTPVPAPTRHAPLASLKRRHSFTGSGAQPQRGSAEGGRPPSAAGHGGAKPPRALCCRAGHGGAQPPKALVGRERRASDFMMRAAPCGRPE